MMKIEIDKMLIVYSKKDEVGTCIAKQLIQITDFSSSTVLLGMEYPYSKGMKSALIALDDELVNADYLDKIAAERILFLSRHSSEKNIPAYTVHATGNWSDKALLGGKPHMLSISDPMLMCTLLNAIAKRNTDGTMQVTYEATHHGPLLNTPSTFVEIEKNSFNEERCDVVAHAIIDAFKDSSLCKGKEVAVGIGGMHYSQKFTSVALSGKYAFSHIMPKYYVDEFEMVRYAFERSIPKASTAIIEWKSINSIKRKIILDEIEKIGANYEKV
jgi:D-aminoacyl-tRNA deacylase